jgi:hypothetical protein
MTFVCVDHQTRLQFGDFEIAFESPFRVTAPDGSEYSLDPGVRASLGPVLDLYPDALVTATAMPRRRLRLRFASGATLDVPADFDFEAWQVNGPDGFLVCATGGPDLVFGAVPKVVAPRHNCPVDDLDASMSTRSSVRTGIWESHPVEPCFCCDVQGAAIRIAE